MRKLRFSLVLFFSTILFITAMTPSASIAKTRALDYSMQTTAAGNPFYLIYVRNEALGTGAYTAATGPQHPATLALGASQNILYDGAIGDPWSSFLTVRSFTTANDYSVNPIGTVPPGYTLQPLDDYNPVVTNDSTSATTSWSVVNGAESFSLTQVLAAEGTTFDNSSIRVTTSVTNNGQAAMAIGIRYLWDIMIADQDGAWCKTVEPFSGWFDTEQDWTPPAFSQFQVTNNPTSPFLYINGSVTGPALSPAPTPPEKLQFADWDLCKDTAFTYTTTGRLVAGVDSAMLTYWGAGGQSPISIAPGATISVTQYLFAPIQESAPTLPYTGK